MELFICSTPPGNTIIFHLVQRALQSASESDPRPCCTSHSRLCSGCGIAGGHGAPGRFNLSSNSKSQYASAISARGVSIDALPLFVLGIVVKVYFKIIIIIS